MVQEGNLNSGMVIRCCCALNVTGFRSSQQANSSSGLVESLLSTDMDPHRS